MPRRFVTRGIRIINQGIISEWVEWVTINVAHHSHFLSLWQYICIWSGECDVSSKTYHFLFFLYQYEVFCDVQRTKLFSFSFSASWPFPPSPSSPTSLTPLNHSHIHNSYACFFISYYILQGFFLSFITIILLFFFCFSSL